MVLPPISLAANLSDAIFAFSTWGDGQSYGGIEIWVLSDTRVAALEDGDTLRAQLFDDASTLRGTLLDRTLRGAAEFGESPVNRTALIHAMSTHGNMVDWEIATEARAMTELDLIAYKV